MRTFGDAALQTLLKSGASASGPPPVHRNIDGEIFEIFLTLKTHLPEELSLPSPGPNGPRMPKYNSLKSSLNFQAALVTDLVHSRKFGDVETWNRCVGTYMVPWLDVEKGSAFAESIRSHHLRIDRVCVLDFFFRRSKLISFRQSTRLRRAAIRKKANCFATLFSLWHTELCSSFPIQHFV